jgi:predicted N-acyltransferase
MAAPLTVRIVEAVSDVPKAAWNALIDPSEPPVVRWEWLDALEQSGSAVPERGWESAHLTAWRGDTLVGTAPAWKKSHSMGEYVYDFGWASAAQSLGIRYYPKLLIGVPLSPLTATRFHVAAGEDEAEVRGALLDAAMEFAKEERCSSVHVIFPPEGEAAALEAAGLHRRSTLQYHWRNPGYRSYDDYLGRFDSKRRNQLKRERGAAAKQGIALRTVASAAIDDGHAELAWKLYQATSARHAWGPVQLNRGFFHRAFEALAASIELVVAERAGKVVAGAFNLHTPQRLYGRYWGCFEDHPFLHFNVCLYHSVDDCIRAGREVFEPGAGGEHKISRGFEPTAIHSAHRIFDPRLDAAVRDFCRREALEVARVAAESATIAGMRPFAPPPSTISFG